MITKLSVLTKISLVVLVLGLILKTGGTTLEPTASFLVGWGIAGLITAMHYSLLKPRRLPARTARPH
jgi:NO-binding membrane sensor protein with MHYT domain